MQKFRISKTVLTSLALLLLVGCQGGGRNITRAKLCTTNMDPLNVEKMGKNINKKVSLDPSKKINEQVDQKEYTFENAQVYVYDKRQNAKLYLSYMKSGQTYVEKVECIGGQYSASMTPIHIEVPFISGITITPTETIFKNRTFKLDIKPDPVQKWIAYKFGTDETQDATKTSPFDYYNEYVNNAHYFLATKAKNVFQLVSVVETFSPSAKDFENRPSPDLEIRILVTYAAK